jgi:feruloyl-CoA synthase
MGATPVTLFSDCTFCLSADGNVRISNSSHIGDFSSRVTERLEHWAATTPNRLFLARRTAAGWREVTYADALVAARRIGQALLDRGLCPSRPVLILSGNGIEHAQLSLACLHVGVPFVPLSTAYSLLSSDHVRLRDIVALVQPALVFADDGSRYAGAIRDCIAADTEVVLVHGESDRAATPFHKLLATTPCRDVEVAAGAIRPDTVAKLLFTSGSTGFPKGVISTQRMICSALQTLRACYPLLAAEPPVLVDWMPWNHIFGGTINFGLAMYNGGTFYIDDGKPLPGLIETTIRNLREVAPVIYSSVPKAFEELVPWLRKDAELRNRFFSRVQLFQCSGASIPQHVCDAFDELALEAVGERIPWVGWFGSTEAGPMLADQHARGSSTGRVGLPVPGVTLSTSLIATSSSGILISDIQGAAVCPERVVVGHPFNPSHLMPLVEVVAGRLTSDECLAAALQFYGATGKKPVHIRGEVKGHAANRLQAALWREAFYLVQQGIVSVGDVDTLVADGLGLRWALLGPFLNLHLSAGAGGITHALEHLGPSMETWWRDLGDVSLNDNLNGLIVSGLDSELAGVDLGDIVARRDQLLSGLLKLKA